jgi:hypothetical protein
MPLSSLSSSGAPVVRCMPGSITPFGENQPYAWINRELIVWGRVDGGVPPYAYEWDFGDGSPPVAGAVTDPEYIAELHTYALANVYFATLTVTDDVGSSASAQVRIDVVIFGSPPLDEKQIRTNAAIQDGLRWLYLHQSSNGSWDSHPASAAAAVAAFETQGHLPSNPTADVYAEVTKAGLEFIFSTLCTFPIGPQPAGNPDTNGNGVGLYSCSGAGSANSAYTQGLMMLAIAVSRDPNAVATNGPPGVAGETYLKILTDMVDQLAYSQTDAGGERGGWRYAVDTASYGSDNSAVQWGTIGLEAAGKPNNGFNISVPQWVKDELDIWLQASVCADGGFGYQFANSWCNIAKTGSGLFSILYVENYQRGDSLSQRAQNALGFLAANWCELIDNNGIVEQFNGNAYALYAVKKPADDFDLVVPGKEWEADYRCHLVKELASPCGSNARHQITDNGDKLNDGMWPTDYWVSSGGSAMSTSFPLLVLIPGISCGIVCGVTSPPAVCPNQQVCFDASSSFTSCPDRFIASWEWDFDASDADNVSFNPPDAVGENVCNPAGYTLAPGDTDSTFTVTLRVRDDSVDVAICEHHIRVTTENVPPVACLNGPFTACVGDTIFLDACCSFDPNETGACAGVVDSIASYEWDLDGDGDVDFTSDTCQPDTFLVFQQEFQQKVTVRVTDTFGETSGLDQTFAWSSFQDVSIGSEDVTFHRDGDTVEIWATIHASVEGGAPDIDSVLVAIYHDVKNPGTLICDSTYYGLAAGDSVALHCVWVIPDSLDHSVIVCVDPDSLINECVETDNQVTVQVPRNTPPDCSGAGPTIARLWPPNHKLVRVGVTGIVDPDGDPTTVAIVGVTSDEPVNGLGDGDTCPDAVIDGSEVELRAERAGGGNGRVYTVLYEATDGAGGICSGSVTVCVPHDRSGTGCTDDGLGVDATRCDEARARADLPEGILFSRPMSDGVSISFNLREASRVRLRIYDISGRLVRQEHDGVLPAGVHKRTWDGKSGEGRMTSAGVYFVRLDIDDRRYTAKTVRVR